MKNQNSTLKYLGIGALTAITVSLFVVPMFKFGISPMPAPPSLLFASVILGTQVPLPVGLFFHFMYVTIWAYIFLKFIPKVSFLNTSIFSFFLWILAITVFFPIINWGFLGLSLGLGPKIMIAALMPHFLFDVFLWFYAQKVFKLNQTSGSETIEVNESK